MYGAKKTRLVTIRCACCRRWQAVRVDPARLLPLTQEKTDVSSLDQIESRRLTERTRWIDYIHLLSALGLRGLYPQTPQRECFFREQVFRGDAILSGCF